MAYGELRGVGGWLAFFILIMAVISPLWSVVAVYQEFHGAEAAFLSGVPVFASLRTFAWGLVAADAMICWFVAYRLTFIHNWASVRLAIAGIWLGGVGGMIAGYVGITTITGLSFGDVMAQTGPLAVVQPFIFGLIWTTYLLKSERVANTYRGLEEQAEIFE